MPSPQHAKPVRDAKAGAVPRPAGEAALRGTVPRRHQPGAALLGLQRGHGNRHVQRMISASPAHLTGLSVGPADDAYEREADRVVERALRTPVPVAGLHDEGAGGHRLPPGFRRRMEAALGADLGDVRLYRGARSDQLNHSLHARAFTAGADIHLRGTEPGLASPAGQRLVAHELAHVVQQRHIGPRIQRAPVTYRLESNEKADAALVQKFFTTARRIERDRKADAERKLRRTERYSEATGTFSVDTTAFEEYQRELPTIGLTPAKFTETGFPQLKADVIERLRTDNDLEGANALGALNLVGKQLQLGSGTDGRTIATVLTGPKAFLVKSRSARDIYTKGSEEKEYVKDDRDVYTRRYAFVEKADYQVRSLVRRGRLSGQYQEKRRWLKQDEDERLLSRIHAEKNYRERPSEIHGLERHRDDYRLSLPLLAQFHQELGSGVQQRGVSLRSTGKEIYGNAGESFWRKGGVLMKVDLAKVAPGNTLISHYGPGGVKEEERRLPTIKGRGPEHYARSVTKNRELYLKDLEPSMIEAVTYHKGVQGGRRDEEPTVTVPEGETDPRRFWTDYLKEKVGYDSYREGYQSRGKGDRDSDDDRTRPAQHGAGFRARGRFWRGYEEGRRSRQEPTLDYLGFLQTEKKRGAKGWTDEWAHHGWDYAHGYVRGHQNEQGYRDGKSDAEHDRDELADDRLRAKGKYYTSGYREGYERNRKRKRSRSHSRERDAKRRR